MDIQAVRLAFADRYAIEKEVGQGSAAIVYLGRSR